MNKDRLGNLIRLIVLLPMVALAFPIRSWVHRVWIDHWLGKDARSAAAIVTQVHPRSVYDYRYAWRGTNYTGTSIRDWEDEKLHRPEPGEVAIILVSESHPWLSSMLRARIAWAGFPFTLLLLLVEFYCLAVLIDPNGRWVPSRWLLDLPKEPR